MEKLKARKTIIVDGEKVTASMGMLNQICAAFYDAAKHYRDTDNDGYADYMEEQSNEIYRQLNALGLYNNNERGEKQGKAR